MTVGGGLPTIGWTYPINDITVANTSILPNYARWTHTFNTGSLQARTYNQIEPEFTERVSQNAQFVVNYYGVAKWHSLGFGFDQTYTLPEWSIGIPKLY